MEALNPELGNLISKIDLKPESRDLLLASVIGERRRSTTSNALGLLRLLDNLRSDEFLGLIPLQKVQFLENLIALIRQDEQEWLSRVCYILYEGNLPLQHSSSLLPEEMVRDLLRWVNTEKVEKVRESLWAILLRKDMRLAPIAKVTNVAAGLCERDPITRNNVIRFLFDHFPPNEVVDSLFQYSTASGKRIPGVVFKRFAGLLKDWEDPQQKKYILEKILSTAKLDAKDIDQIFSDYMSSLNRFDLVRLLTTGNGSSPELLELKRKGGQIGFEFDCSSATSSQREKFRQRVYSLMHV